MKGKVLHWHRHIDKQAKSSLTVQNYCDRYQLSCGMVYDWKRKLKESAEPTFAEVQIVDPERYREAIHVRFPSGVELWLDHATEPTILRAIVGC